MNCTWSVKESRIMQKTGRPLLSLSVMDSDHEVHVTSIAMKAKETFNTCRRTYSPSSIIRTSRDREKRSDNRGYE